MSDRWIVSYTNPDGSPGSEVWESASSAKSWIDYHRGQNLLYNLEVRFVTNWKPISPQAAKAMTGQLGTHETSNAVPSNNCPHCGLVHATTCYRIKAIQYAEDGVTVVRIEFHEPNRTLNPVGSLAGTAPAPIGTGGPGQCVSGAAIGGAAGMLHNKD